MLSERLDEQAQLITELQTELERAHTRIDELEGLEPPDTELLDGRIGAVESDLAELGEMIRVENGDLVIGHADHRGTELPEKATDHDVIIAGANLFVVNGAGQTATVNQRGNVVLGYGESGIDAGHSHAEFDEDTLGLEVARAGSHNLVIGPMHGYTAWGSVLVGTDNAVDAPGAVVFGRRNYATADWNPAAPNVYDAESTLVTGSDNRSFSAPYAVVLGGNSNRATDQNDAILGGGAVQPTSGSSGSRTYVGALNVPVADLIGHSYTTWVGGGDATLYLVDPVYP